MARPGITRALALALLLAVLPPASAAELYAQAIGQPPERPPAPAVPPAPPPVEPAEPQPPAARTADAGEARRQELRARILIGAGIALALGALAGGGNGGGEAVPQH